MMARWRMSRRRDAGASAVEFALVLPILVMLVFGIIAFGFVFAQSLALNNSAREASRAGVVQQRTCGDILTTVQSSASTLAMNGSNVSVEVSRTGAGVICPNGTSYSSPVEDEIPCQGSTAGDQLTVTTEYETTLIIPLVFTTPTFDLTGKGVFRCEFS